MDDALKLFVIAVLVLVYGLSLYGWGRIAERMVRVRWPAPLTLTIGIAVLLFVGGWLNLASLAYAAVLDALAVLGLLAACLDIVARRKQSGDGAARLGSSLRSIDLARQIPSSVLVGVVFVFVALTQVPPGAVNFHDDFEYYLLFPVHMLATGSVDTGSFSNIGIASFGGLSFLQGFVLAHWPLASVNAVDALFGLVLCMSIVYAVGFRLNLPRWVVLLAMATVVFIDPQYVNVSTIYLGSALVMLIAFVSLGRKQEDGAKSAFSTGQAAIVGFAYAAMVSLKMTFFVPLLIHFVVSALAVSFVCRNLKSGITWAFKVGAFGVVGIAPWVFNLFGSRFADILAFERSEDVDVHAPGAEIVPPLPDFFSDSPMHYGFGATSYLHYTVLTLFIVIFGLALAYRAYRKDAFRSIEGVWPIAICVFLAIYFVLSALTVGRYVMGHNANLRYVVPILIGTFPATALFFTHAVGQMRLTDDNRQSAPARRAMRGVAMIGLPLVVALLIFLQPLVGRAYQAIVAGSVLGFDQTAKNPAYIDFNRFAFSEEARKELAEIQAQVPEGEGMVAMVALPVHFDFARNDILVVHGGGLGWHYQDFPFTKGVDAARTYFKARGIDYILWQREGFAVRTLPQHEQALHRTSSSHRRVARYSISFIETLKTLSETEEVIHADAKYTLLKLN